MQYVSYNLIMFELLGIGGIICIFGMIYEFIKTFFELFTKKKKTPIFFDIIFIAIMIDVIIFYILKVYS